LAQTACAFTAGSKNVCSGDAKPTTGTDAATAITTPAKATRSFGCKNND